MASAPFLKWIGQRTEDLFLSIRARVILSYLVIVAVGFIYLTRRMQNDVRPRYLAAEEEIMVDIAHLLAAKVEQGWGPSGPDVARLQQAVSMTQQRRRWISISM
jgi:hypothetical protein